ncbi:MAG: hypothetical protein M9887_02010 [Chitinophagales bacterium]|nr:hypothetical protein [Chitinophagales bacterium]
MGINILVLLISIISLSACDSKNLSHKKAKELIVEAEGLPYDETTKLPKEYYIRQYYEQSGFIPPVGLWGGAHYSDEKDKLDQLQADGLINIEEKEREQGILIWVLMNVTLTEKGKQYLKSEDEDNFTLRTSTIDFGEITGVQTYKELGGADVYYTIVRTNLTPFGKNLSTEAKDRLENMALFDDGWKVR